MVVRVGVGLGMVAGVGRAVVVGREVVVLSMLGGAAGLVIAGLLVRVLNQWASPYGHVAVSADARVYLAALILTLVSALLFGMIPARQVSHSSPLQAMKSGPADSTPLRRFTLRDLLLGGTLNLYYRKAA